MRSSQFRLGVAAAPLLAAALTAHASCVMAQPAGAGEAYDAEVDELVVEGTREPPGQVLGDITPELTMSPREIRAYGAASVSELLQALAPQLSSGQGGGRPVVLIDGVRTSGFSEVRDLPTEAIARVDILPEEVSLKYGYPADQKVVNFVLRRRFRAVLLEGGRTTPTQSGGGETTDAHGALLHIRDGRRLNVDGKGTWTQPIYESDRDIDRGDDRFRTLQADRTDAVLNAVYARPFGEGFSGSINGTFENTQSDSQLGLNSLSATALTRRSNNDDARLAGSAAGAWNGWQWSYSAELSRNLSKTATDRVLNGTAFADSTHAVTTSALTDLVVNKQLFELPAGRAGLTLTARASTTELDSEGLRAGVAQSSDLSRSVGELRASLDAPITRDGEGLGEILGRLSANVNVGLEHLSDFGDLQTAGYGLHWRPTSKLRVIAAFSATDEAPTINQLGDPTTVTPGVRTYDLARGESVEVTRVSGGSPGLQGGRTDIIKLGFSYKPFAKTNLNFQADYVEKRIRDGIVDFPSASTQVESAFPDRFTRDADGILTRIDARPVNVSEQTRQELRWGFTYSRPVGPTPSPEAIAAFRRRMTEENGRGATPRQDGAAAPASEGRAQGRPGGEAQTQNQTQAREGAPPDRGPGQGGPPPGFRGPSAGPGRGFGPGARGGVLQISLRHTVAFRDEVVLRDGLPALDLLDGAALGAAGGSPRHQVDLRVNYSRGGLGAAMNADWQSATRVTGGRTGQTLEFSDLTKVNLRLFADLGAQPFARDHKWLRGARATLSVDNLFDAREEVRAPDGTTPETYQPDLLDPVGRTVKFTVRKLIF